MSFNPNNIYYSLDNGQSWEGPFSQEEIDALTQAGIIPQNVMTRRNGEPAPAAASLSAQAEPSAPPLMEQAAHNHEPEYMLGINGQTHGPFTKAQIMAKKSSGQIPDNAQYWTQGIRNWRPVAELLAVPPPIESAQNNLPKLQGFSLGKFFAEVFTHHTKEEMDDILCCGSSKTIPDLMSIDTSWPTPWIFARILLACLIVYFGFNWASSTFDNSKLLPGIIFVGNFAVPFCVFVLFFELNVRRDISIYNGIKGLIGGGLLSLIFALFLFKNTGDMHSALGAPWAGPVEELGKLLAVLFIIRKIKEKRILTGLMMGSAIGAGFAAFESSGYVFEEFMRLFSAIIDIQNQRLSGKLSIAQANTYFDQVLSNWNPDGLLQMRALYAPFCHVIWTAITAGAFCMVQTMRAKNALSPQVEASTDWGTLVDSRFLKIAIIPVILHMVWNYGFCGNVAGVITLGVIGWIVALRLVQRGLQQIREEQEQQSNQQR